MPFFGLSTRRKIALARIARAAVSSLRRIQGCPMQGEFTRNNVRWSLDLNEGIDFAIFLFGAFEPELLGCYKNLIQPGATILDLGANIGAHTLPLAYAVGCTGRVIGVEATEFAYQKLIKNVSLNPSLARQITAVHALLAESESANIPSALHSSWPLTGNAAIHPTLGGTLKTLGNARALSLDSLLSNLDVQTVSYIKLDVDGNELTVLRGATRTLNKHRPGIFMELAPYCFAERPEEFDALVQLLWSFGYVFRNPKTRQLLPTTMIDLKKSIPVNGSINVYAEALFPAPTS